MDTPVGEQKNGKAKVAKPAKPIKRKLKNDLAALGSPPLEDMEDRPKRVPRVAARKAQESVAALPENSPTGSHLRAASPLTLQNSPVITAKMPNLKYESAGVKRGASFVEPELAVPKPGFSGHTLESFPPAKVKRAAVTIGKSKRGRKPALAPKPDDGSLAEREKQYISHLQTVKSESLSQASDLRARVSNGSASSHVISIPATPSSTFGHHTSPGRSIKRLKITSPKKPPALLARAAPDVPEPSDDNNNDDYCSTCGGTGVFICCDSCPKSFHLLCCNPPLQEIPEENWNCTECLAKHRLIPKKSYKSYGMFSSLLNTIHGRNPTEFRLPKKLRDSTFMGVSTGDDLEYTDGSMKPDVPVSKNAQLNGFNINEELDVDSLYDAEGKPHLCHKCKMSGLQRRTMVACDFCPLWWHLDCLPGVVCSAKTLGQKWRCPNHIESVVPASWLERRSFKDAIVLDASVHNNFLRFVQANKFLIKYKEDPYLADDASMSLQDYQQSMAYVQNISNFEQRYGDYSQVESEDDDDVDVNYKVPEYMQNYAIGKRIMAKSSAKLAKVLVMTNGTAAQPYIYRVPEQNLVLDFINTNARGIKDNIAYYENHKKMANDQDMDAVGVLLEMHGRKDNECRTSDGEDTEHKAKVEEAVTKGDAPADLKALHPGTVDTKDTIEELEEIRKLIELKGKDKLMDFLKS